MSTPHPDGNLLLGVLALQNNFVRQDALIAAMHEWVVTKSRPLGHILLEKGALSVERLALLDSLVREQARAGPSGDGQGLPTTLIEPAPPAPLRFNVVRPHATGGLGEVFVARDGELSREVALKQIKAQHADHLESRLRFVREAEITGGLEHPGVVPVYGLGRYADGRPYYAMRFIRGESLHDALRRFHAPGAETGDPSERTLEERKLLNQFVAVCQTIAYAHSRGVIHRDLKPANIMLGPYGETLVVDWGLAKLLEQVEPIEPGASLPLTATVQATPPTQLGRLLGTPAYMAPEQAIGRTDLHSISTDVYGLGAVLYEVLTGRTPYSGESTNEILSKVRNEPTPLARAVRPAIPQALEEIAAKSMSKELADRHASASELASAVQRWLSDGPLEAYRRAEEQLTRFLHDSPDSVMFAEELARTRVSRGLVLGGMGRDAEAAQAFDAALAGYSALIEQQPDVGRFVADRAACCIHYSHVLERLGKSVEAERMRRDAVSAYDLLIAANPLDYRTNLASVMLTLAPGVIHTPPPVEESGQGTVDLLPRDSEEEQIEETEGDGTLMPSEMEMSPLATRHPPPSEVPSSTQAEQTRENRGRFTLIQMRAQGGMSEIWLARDNDLNRKVILKQLRLDDADARARFLMEAQVLSQLSHPNILPVFGLGYKGDSGAPFIVLHYAENGTLLDAIRRHYEQKPGARTIAQLLSCFASACDALAYAHKRGVINFDPKPSNILLGRHGETFVADWGLASVKNRQGEGVELSEWARPLELAQGNIMGTPAYMAPEQWGTKQPDARTDVYVLGSTLFHILSGQPPRSGKKIYEIALEATQGPTPRVRDVNPNAPAALAAVCAKAMAFKQDDRYQSAADLARDVRSWLAREPVSVYAESKLSRWFRSRRSKDEPWP